LITEAFPKLQFLGKPLTPEKIAQEANAYMRLFQNFSFGTVTYPKEKIAFVYMFTSYRVSNFLQELVSKPTGF
jgi:hypothetical protein